tara:strand:+ start:555 stop:854 length:300 start_codon:yes stop_codon:yes gene_type:complete
VCFISINTHVIASFYYGIPAVYGAFKQKRFLEVLVLVMWNYRPFCIRIRAETPPSGWSVNPAKLTFSIPGIEKGPYSIADFLSGSKLLSLFYANYLRFF